jgi:D-alanyl-D-alanine carboxypeptidase
LTPTPAVWPTVTTQVLSDEIAAGLHPCAARIVRDDDLLLFVSQQFSLPESYVPSDLVFVRDYFGESVTLGLGNQVRLSIIEPLRQMIEAMHAAGLKPSILSGYRSYGEQYLAWKWWNSQYPERVAIMSARAGHSEHQLGTTVDFGSPALDHLFHVDFAETPEGIWLRDNAHLYGFTMSYPAGAYETTGFKYEPWHFRYVTTDISIQLQTTGQILTEWQLAHQPPPCIP